MNLIISFSARESGNCDRIAKHISSAADKIVFFRNVEIHPCSNCSYECFQKECKYRADDIYNLYDTMCKYDKVVLIVPMYCGNPASLYFIFNERFQDYIMHNDIYEEIIRRLYIIGIYGKAETSPDYIPCFEKWFDGSPFQNRVLGIERHLYGQKLHDNVLDVAEVKTHISTFLK